jgi:mycothiol system anti-sigma-R factor
MDCERLFEVLFLYLDDELDDAQLSPLKEHLENCPHCSQRADYTRKLLVLVRERCVRCQAPTRLRVRILTSFPHRRDPLSFPPEHEC